MAIKIEREPQASVLIAIVEERIRQDAKFGEQFLTHLEWLAVLTEEVGELAHDCVETCLGREDRSAQLEAELVQVAAVATAWLEYIQKRRIRD